MQYCPISEHPLFIVIPPLEQTCSSSRQFTGHSFQHPLVYSCIQNSPIGQPSLSSWTQSFSSCSQFLGQLLISHLCPSYPSAILGKQYSLPSGSPVHLSILPLVQDISQSLQSKDCDIPRQHAKTKTWNLKSMLIKISCPTDAKGSFAKHCGAQMYFFINVIQL